MDLSKPLIAELQHESLSIRKMLELVPKDSLLWKPHEKSRSIGEVALHIANIPGIFIAPINRDEFDRNEYRTAGETLATFDRNIADAIEVLQMIPNLRMFSLWQYKVGEKIILEMPRLAVIRAMGINHLIHHRGQLSVYLRYRPLLLYSLWLLLRQDFRLFKPLRNR